MILPKHLPADVAIETPVSLRDLPATIMSLLQPGAANRFPGASLERYWDSAHTRQVKAPSAVVSEVRKGIRTPPQDPVSKGDMRSVIVEPYHYILNGDGQEELYDLSRDPLEQHDLSKAMEAAARLEYFRQSLKTNPVQR
jgi:hypothetical protein